MRIISINIKIKNNVAEDFNDFYVKVGPEQVSGIPTTRTSFHSYFTQREHEMSDNELEKAVFSLKSNKSPRL